MLIIEFLYTQQNAKSTGLRPNPALAPNEKLR
ncbi:hypothetical protein KM92DES2_11109 [uncultured Desulfovibrio sp.]|uniref:Uncharacterized protein n=1 Tax=uncultured Desulfovibrio sp. TaxID=167968 RepID=A0A212JHF8_9BACT|nr:hypothetical protein KM92DES2_11109 [uncultured Desulfovibrio sp.]